MTTGFSDCTSSLSAASSSLSSSVTVSGQSDLVLGSGGCAKAGDCGAGGCAKVGGDCAAIDCKGESVHERTKSSAADVTQRRNVALITGVSGQDGTYLCELLLEKSYQVHGIVRPESSLNKPLLDSLVARGSNSNNSLNKGTFRLHYGDITDSACLLRIIDEVQPTEIYNLAAQSHVKASFDLSEYTADVDAVGVLRLLEIIRKRDMIKRVKFYQASSGEMFGKVQETPQTESTAFWPRSPYGVAKLYSYWITRVFREEYQLFAVNGILFNHESPRRGINFVTRKITLAAARISLGKQEFVELGNINARRDWGHAKDYVEAMWLMLQREVPEDFVISTGIAHTVREFIEAAFNHVNINIVWEGTGVNEVGKDEATGVVRVKMNPAFYRNCEVESLLGDCSKAKTGLNWEPKYTFKEIIAEMMDSDLKYAMSSGDGASGDY